MQRSRFLLFVIPAKAGMTIARGQASATKVRVAAARRRRVLLESTKSARQRDVFALTSVRAAEPLFILFEESAAITYAVVTLGPRRRGDDNLIFGDLAAEVHTPATRSTNRAQRHAVTIGGLAFRLSRQIPIMLEPVGSPLSPHDGGVLPASCAGLSSSSSTRRGQKLFETNCRLRKSTPLDDERPRLDDEKQYTLAR